MPSKDVADPARCNPAGAQCPGEHCHIVGVVAQRLIALPASAGKVRCFHLDAAFAAACHDLGKVSPSFVEKLRRHCSSGMEHIPKQAVSPELEKAGVAMQASAWRRPRHQAHRHGFQTSWGSTTGFRPNWAASRPMLRCLAAAPGKHNALHWCKNSSSAGHEMAPHGQCSAGHAWWRA